MAVFTIQLIFKGGGPQDGLSETIEIDSSQDGAFLTRSYPVEGQIERHVYQSSSEWNRRQKKVVLSYLGTI
jgi:hypothetical protein